MDVLRCVSYNVTYDIDPAATAIARQNFSSFDCEVDVVHVDVETMRRWTAEDMGEAEEEERMEDDSANTTAGRLRRTGGGNKGTSRCGGRGGGRGSARPRPRTQTRTRAAQPRSRRESDSDSEGDEESPESPPPPPPSSSSSRTPSSHSSLPPCVLDTVVLNPPFGTRHSGVDVTFLHVALQLSHHSVYSLHKTSTRPFFRRLCEKWGVVGEVVAEMRFELKRSYSFHREKSRDVEVDLWRFTFSKDLGRPDRFSRKGHSTAPPTSQPPSYS